jgi:hypothetical protein
MFNTYFSLKAIQYNLTLDLSIKFITTFKLPKSDQRRRIQKKKNNMIDTCTQI